MIYHNSKRQEVVSISIIIGVFIIAVVNIINEWDGPPSGASVAMNMLEQEHSRNSYAAKCLL